MSESMSMRDRYLEVIDNIVDSTLQGKIASKEQVYQLLVENIEPGTGEIFERCLLERLETTQAQLETKIKATRIYRALQMIQGQWERWQKENQTTATLSGAVQQVLSTDDNTRLLVLLRVLDPNQKEVLTLDQLQQFSQALSQAATSISNPKLAEEVQELADGIAQGLKNFSAIESNLLSWIFERNRGALGFGEVENQREPWYSWAKQVNAPLVQQLFNTLAQNESIRELGERSPSINLTNWVDLVILLQFIQRGLVNWFDKQPYDVKGGKQLSTRTLLTFSVIWNQLAMGLQANHTSLANGSFQVTLQLLRSFAQRDDFPLYGGIFASFSGEYLRDTLSYLDEPLGRFEATPEKARILTLLGYSQRALGRYDRAIQFHTEAVEIARNTKDSACEVANLNHLSRIYVSQKNYPEALNYSQRALILARQEGDKLGQANALVNYGYSEVFAAQASEESSPEIYEQAISYLEQGLELSQQLADKQSLALCYNSLGIAYVLSGNPSEAIAVLQKGLQAAQFSGDLYLQGLNFSYLAEAYYSMANFNTAVYVGCLGMYLLHQIGAKEWQSPGALISRLQIQLGEEKLGEVLQQHRSNIIPIIGVDGYDYIPQLIVEYRRSHE